MLSLPLFQKYNRAATSWQVFLIMAAIFLYLNVVTLKYKKGDLMEKAVKERAAQGRKYTTITIPAPLFEKIKRMIGSTGFSSVSDYATYVLRETLIDIESNGKGSKGEIASRLKALGYI
jgi:hypothetical protein